MNAVTTALLWIIRLTGLTLLVLGLCFWFGIGLSLVPLHMLDGLVFVLALWGLAIVALRARVGAGPAVGAILWGVAVLALGLSQRGLLPGAMHWLVQAIHLLLGLAALGAAEMLAARIRRSVIQPAL